MLKNIRIKRKDTRIIENVGCVVSKLPGISKLLMTQYKNIEVASVIGSRFLTSCMSSLRRRTMRVPLVMGTESSLVTTKEPPAADSQQCCSSSLFLEYTVT